MKNIHVLPTDKPSRLFEIFQFNFVFDKQNMYSEEYKKLHSYKNQNIYITSDEEIKEGDWYLSIDNFVRKADVIWDNVYGKYPNKKIILTTDQDLIKDGVQAIDNGFLEWFVKNPNCEWVEVQKGFEDGTSYGYNFLDYKIIIPKEEPKFENSIDNTMNIMSIANSMFGKKEEPKQETLEELAEKLQEEIKYGASISDIIDTLTKWQQEQDKKMYSDEDITKFVSFVGKNYIKAKGFYYIKGDFEKKHKVSIHQILEQFKNN